MEGLQSRILAIESRHAALLAEHAELGFLESDYRDARDDLTALRSRETAHAKELGVLRRSTSRQQDDLRSVVLRIVGVARRGLGPAPHAHARAG